MNSKWLKFGKKAKVVIAGVLAADTSLIIAWLTGTDGVITLVGILSATIPPFLAYWVSND